MTDERAFPGNRDRGPKRCVGLGTADGDHCCYLSGKVCDFLVDNETPGPGRFRCALRQELGSWDAVHEDPRYQPIQAHWDSLPGQPIKSCGDWQPTPGECCREAR